MYHTLQELAGSLRALRMMSYGQHELGNARAGSSSQVSNAGSSGGGPRSRVVRKKTQPRAVTAGGSSLDLGVHALCVRLDWCCAVALREE